MKQSHFARLLLFIALGHLATGIALFAPYLAEIPSRGWVNSVGPNFLEGSLAVWFLLFSWPLLMLVIQFWNSADTVKKPLSWLCVTGSILGISLMPLSGFWLMLGLSGFALIKRSEAQAPV